MKLLQLCQKYFSMLGISSNELRETENFSLNNLMWIPVFALNIISYVVFITKEVNNFIEYMFSIYMISATIATATSLATIAFRMQKFCNLIIALEQNVDDS